MIQRRDFLKMLGGALGAVTLTTSCGSSGGSTAATLVAPIPNGYRFYRVLSSGDALPGGNTLAAVPGSVSLNNINEIYFYGMDQSSVNGYYELAIDYAKPRPAVARVRKVVREGDVLNDSKEVVQINMGDMNDNGSVAAVIQTNDKLSGLYLEREKKGFDPVAGYLAALPGGGGKFGAIFGDVDIHSNDDILLVAHFAPDGSAQAQQGLFYLPGGEVNQKGSIVASTQDLIPNIDGFVTGIGLVDLHDNGNYVMQAYGVTTTAHMKQQATPSGGTLDSISASMLISGHVGTQASKVLHSASHILKSRVAAVWDGLSVGEVMYGPRIGANNDVAYVVHETGTQQVLNYNGKQVYSTASLSPLGATIVSMSAPVVGSNGLLYTQVVTDKGLELLVYNGAELKTVLSKDDQVDGAPLSSFFFGFMPDQVDSSGRIVLTGDFPDGSTSIIVGIPI